jgi:hypothetical protein
MSCLLRLSQLQVVAVFCHFTDFVIPRKRKRHLLKKASRHIVAQNAISRQPFMFSVYSRAKNVVNERQASSAVRHLVVVGTVLVLRLWLTTSSNARSSLALATSIPRQNIIILLVCSHKWLHLISLCTSIPTCLVHTGASPLATIQCQQRGTKVSAKGLIYVSRSASSGRKEAYLRSCSGSYSPISIRYKGGRA